MSCKLTAGRLFQTIGSVAAKLCCPARYQPLCIKLSPD